MIDATGVAGLLGCLVFRDYSSLAIQMYLRHLAPSEALMLPRLHAEVLWRISSCSGNYFTSFALNLMWRIHIERRGLSVFKFFGEAWQHHLLGSAIKLLRANLYHICLVALSAFCL